MPQAATAFGPLSSPPRSPARSRSPPLDLLCPRILPTPYHARLDIILQIRPRWKLNPQRRLLLAAPSGALSVDRVCLAVALAAGAHAFDRVQPKQIVLFRGDRDGANCCALPLKTFLFPGDWVEAELLPGPPSCPPPQFQLPAPEPTAASSYEPALPLTWPDHDFVLVM